MNKISELISTPVISLYESEYLGIIYNIIFDYKQKKCKYAIILDESENIPKIVKFSDIYRIGKECIFIKNSSCVELQANCDKELCECVSPVNLKIYSLDGEQVGTSIDIILDDNFELLKLISNNGKEIPSSKICNIGKNIILIDDKNINISKFKPKQKIIKSTPKEENKVLILSDFIKEEKQQNTKILTDFRFLVGRILNKDIVALNGELIAKNGSIVTKDIVNKASFYGKLVEIARYSNKKN